MSKSEEEEHYGLMRLLGKIRQQPITVRFSEYVDGPKHIIGAGMSKYYGICKPFVDGLKIDVTINNETIFLAVWDFKKNRGYQFIELFDLEEVIKC